MTDWLLALVPQYGLWLLFITTFLSCLALPLPSSILMMTAGGFVAAGDLAFVTVVLAAFGGAVAGDQLGFQIGRRGGPNMLARLQNDPNRGKLVSSAAAVIHAKGDGGIFLSRWLFSPLGPYANFVAGAVMFSWWRFTIAAALGEAVWVGIYVGMGYSFAGNLEAANEMLGSVLGILVGGAVMVGLGLWLYAVSRRPVGGHDEGAAH